MAIHFYGRISTDEQAESRAGLNAQTDAAMAYAAREGQEIAGTYYDEAVSGAAGLDKRPGLLEALASLEKGDTLLVAKRDRLGRDPMVIAMIEASVKRSKARIISIAGEGTESDDPTSILMRRIVDAFGEYERLVIKARTKVALVGKKKRGERTGSVPMGFDLVDDGKRSKGGLPIALVPNAREQEALALVRELRASGLSIRAIVAEMNSRGIPTKQGGQWHISTVQNALKVA